MFKIIILLLCMTLALPGSSQSASIHCQYKSDYWSYLGTVYRCEVKNSVRITSLDAAQINSVTGTHLAGYNNDNVEAFYVRSKGQIHYFPCGLNKIFKNLKGIYIGSTGLKEIHQKDLKYFPNLKYLALSANSLEILEKDLFEFNPDLEVIYLYFNKITHIDPNVFDKLTNLKTLYLTSNVCINIYASNNSTAVQNVIKTAKNQCINSDYSNLEQKVKNFEAESSALSSEQFKEKLEKLENEVKNSKFPIFFRDKLLGIRADQVIKAQQEATPTTTTTEPTTTTAERSKLETCSALESKVDKMTENLTDLMILATNGTNTQQCDALKDDLRNRNEDIDTKLEILQNIKNAVTIDHVGLLKSLGFRTDKIEKTMKEQDRKFDELDQKLLILCMTLALPGSSQSASFECKYDSDQWSNLLGTVYHCTFRNSVRITSPDAAQIDSVTVTHLAGYNNDNVEVFSVLGVQIDFFPRGLNKIFKNIKGIYIASAGLKEIHQKDLKHFPYLKYLALHANNLEILEKNLFEFNPDLEVIYLNFNKISHIDPNVFDKLTKLKSLNLNSNVCIKLDAYKSRAVQNVIKAAKAKCTNSDYSNLEQKVKNLEAESSALSSEQFKEKLEKLENEVKNSKFPNFFRDKLLGIRADQVKKVQQEAKTPTTTTEPTTTTTESSKLETCSALESKVDKMTENLTDLMILATNGTNTQQCAALKDDLRNRNEDMDTKLETLDENVQNTKTAMLREIQNIKNAATIDHAGLLASLRFRTDKIEKAMKEMKEQNQNMDKKLAKIMKALNINE
ncbi:toll-like receptor Tollo [Chironomus tepperi]|uniref:toll-like receptor Tollo n=1 Tax=Chironomus tepperi TaxID=113505 RepID=UPI00391FAFD7